jgi:hypothetical protein
VSERIAKKSQKEVVRMLPDVEAEAVRAYEVEIKTGPSRDEEGINAEVWLLGEPSEVEGEEQGELLGRIYFFRPEITLKDDGVDRLSRPILHLHTDMLSSVLNLLDSENPVFVEEGRLFTSHL